MTIASGTRLGPYEIVRPIDSGGMGEVYRARDTRLDRVVALKVIRDERSRDPKLMARFEREARAVSALAHPNVCQLYDVGTANGTSFLVMEHIEGETLASRLREGPLRPAEAARIAAEIALALDAAHRRQIVHRDVKPSNMMLAKTGPKLLDFGIARQTAPSATTDAITEEAGTPGTLAYMSPEQISGMTGDARSDIWALGAVLYEMVTGVPPFRAATRADLMSLVLSGSPDLGKVADGNLARIIEKCLSRDPDDRWQSARDLASQLRWAAESPATTPPVRPRSRLLPAAAVLLLLAVALLVVWSLLRSRSGTVRQSLSIALPPGAVMGIDAPAVALSPDGRRVAFSVREDGVANLYIRPIDGFQSQLLAREGSQPAFSPDGEEIAFARGTRIFRVRWPGGGEQFVAHARSNVRGISWGRDGSIYFASLSGEILRVRKGPSLPEPVTRLDARADENSHRWPEVTPDGRYLLYTVRTGQLARFDEARIALTDLRTGRTTSLLEGGMNPRFLPPSTLLFGRLTGLYKVEVDLESGTIRGKPEPVVERSITNCTTGAAQYAVAVESGSLVYLAGTSPEPVSTFRIVDRAGLVLRTLHLARPVDAFKVSPDSKKIAIQVAAANDDIWIWDHERDTVTRLSFLSGDEMQPSWAYDGRSVYYVNYAGLYRQPVEQTGTASLVVSNATGWASSSSPAGLIAFTRSHPANGLDIWITDDGGKTPPALFAGGPFDETHPQFSKDGRWLAYLSNESGTYEAYMRPLAGTERIQLSSAGAQQLRWSADGKELFYRMGEEFFAVPVRWEEKPVVSRPKLLFRMSSVWRWDAYHDGFILLSPPRPELESQGINVLPDWRRSLR